MLTYGDQVGQSLMTIDITSTDALDDIYYDGERVFFQIADFTGQSQPWVMYAQKAEEIYRYYLRNNNYRAAGYENFGGGLYEDYVRFSDVNSYTDLTQLSQNAAFADADLSCPGYTIDPVANTCDQAMQKYSRETAYAIQTSMLAEKAGAPRNNLRVDTLVALALNHINIWTTGQFLDPDPHWHFVQAFMTGLTGSALIDYYQRSVELGTPDNRVPPKLQALADWLWTHMWVSNVNNSGFGAFNYVTPTTTGVGGESPAPDLNQLIAPYFAWVYQYTCNAKYRQEADLIFAGGAVLADLNAGKRFDQNYRDSFNYLKWRDAGDRNCN